MGWGLGGMGAKQEGACEAELLEELVAAQASALRLGCKRALGGAERGANLEDVIPPAS